MHYDILYPNALPGQSPEENLVKKSMPIKCAFDLCHIMTQWYNTKHNLYVCSTQHNDMAVYHKERDAK